MVFNTATIGTAVTPVVVGTFFSHYLNRSPRAEKPTAHISYDEGLNLIRKFLLHVSHHTVEDVQRFTAQWVPHPTWVKVDVVKIPQEYLTEAAEAIQGQLGHHGIEKIGGKTWWQWRLPGNEVRAEWIEMKTDYLERKKNNDAGKRVMLYIHGGAYFFGSVDMHRYQLQRHARKLKARVFAPEYRLAPQFPFPCGLQDCLAAYLYLLTIQDPSTIIFAGDSAGGGMVVSMLVTLRDQGLPLPAGAILISPWVDLTHSFPSVAATSSLDYIPEQGFHQRPSAAWPPPNSDDMLAISEGMVKKLTSKEHISPTKEQDAVQGFHINSNPEQGALSHHETGTVTSQGTDVATANTVPGPGHEISIMIDGKLVVIKDQIQMYASNQLISHPLVSPILQPSLGGLPPLLILTGGGEMLRDEQIYLAHKAANPAKYPPGDAFLDENPHDHSRDQIGRWKPTDVQLQVWDDLCHVAPTLSFTRPAKYMYRSIAQFGAWALARAQKTEIEILDDDAVSIISGSEDEGAESEKKSVVNPDKNSKSGSIGKAGDPLPPFKNHMIRQCVDRHGDIYPLGPASSLPGCTLPPNEIGVIKEGPVRKWMAAKLEWDTKFSSSKRKVQKQRAKEMARGYQTFGDGEVPPPSALAGRRQQGDLIREDKRKKSIGLSMWSGWGSKHDKETMDRELQADKEPEMTVASEADGANARPLDDIETKQGEEMSRRKKSKGGYSRSRSRRRTVTDEHQTDQPDNVDENTSIAELLALRKANGHLSPEYLSPNVAATTPAIVALVPVTSEKANVEPKGGDSDEHDSDDEAPKEDEPNDHEPKEERSEKTNGHVNEILPGTVLIPASSEKDAENVEDKEPKEEPSEKVNGYVNGLVIAASIPVLENTASPIPLPAVDMAADNLKDQEQSESTNGHDKEYVNIASSIPAPDLATEPLKDEDAKDKPAATTNGHVMEPVSAASIPVPEKIENAAAKDTEAEKAEMNPTLNSASVEPNETAVVNPSDMTGTTQKSKIMATENIDGKSLEESQKIIDEIAKDASTAKAAEAAPVSPTTKVSAAAASSPITTTTEKAAESAPMTSKTVPPITTTSAKPTGSNGKKSPDTAKVVSPKTKGKSFGFGLLRRGTKELVSPVAKVEEKVKDKVKEPSKSVSASTAPAPKVEEKAKVQATVPAKSGEAHVPTESPKDKVNEDLKSTTTPSAAPAANAVTATAPAVAENKGSKKPSISGDGITLPQTSQSTRPKSKGVAFPFSLKRSTTKGSPAPSSASVATITSSVGVPAGKDVRTPGAMGTSASSSTKAKAAEPETAAKTVVPNGEPVAAASRPAVKSHAAAVAATGSGTSSTPDDLLPVPAFKGMDSDQKSISSAKSVHDYLTW